MIPNSTFDASKDVTPVVLLMSTPLVLVTTGLGGTVEGGPPAVLDSLIRSGIPRWSKLVRERTITLQ